MAQSDALLELDCGGGVNPELDFGEGHNGLFHVKVS